ncbi:LysR substrate-binding domain-containing protein [Asticcacaulis solisilvae]|uniref:LysR substrate-binding domain-containing protein n=1 Tax=Asticcacaulis solisilvae TaxID=1217274 RepID=UPI003FD88E41
MQAARRLHLSQPTVSKQLKALEERYRISLFLSRTPPLKLTPAGEALFREANQLFSSVDNVEQILEDDQSDRLLLRLGSDTPPLAARLAHEMKIAFPRLHCQVRIENARDTFELLRSGQCDMAIVTDPPVHPNFQYVPIREDRLMAAFPTDHPAARLPAFDIRGLADESLLMRETWSRTRTAIQRLFTDVDVMPRDIQDLHTRETIREAIALGMGMSFFFSIECAPDPRIVYLPIRTEVPLPAIHYYLISVIDKRHHPMFRRATDIAKAWYAPAAAPELQRQH